MCDCLSMILFSSLLLDANVKLAPKDKRGYTPLHLVAKTANEKVMMLLLEAGAPVNERSRKEVT